MAYKFQKGATKLSGSVTFSEAVTANSGLDNGDNNITNVGDINADKLSIADAANGLSIDATGANNGTFEIIMEDNDADALSIKDSGGQDYIVFDTSDSGQTITFSRATEFGTVSASSDVSVGGTLTAGTGRVTINAAGALAGATSIDATGDLTVGSITMSEFTVAANGNTDIDGTLNVEGVPTFQAGAVFSSGITTAGAIAGATTISGSGTISGHVLDIETTANIGTNLVVGGNLTVNGTTTTVDTDNLTVKDKNILLNSGSSASSAGGAGLDVQEDGYTTVFVRAASDRMGWEFQAPGSNATIELSASAASTIALAGNLTTNVATTISVFGASLIDDADAATARTTLGLAIGSNVQAHDAQLDTLAGMSAGTATALAALAQAEVQILDDATVTTAELNILDTDKTQAQSVTLVDADHFIISDGGTGGTLKHISGSALKSYIGAGTISVYSLSGSTIDGIIGSVSGSGLYVNAGRMAEDNLHASHKYLLSGSDWSAGDIIRLKAPTIAGSGKIELYALSASLGNGTGYQHYVDAETPDETGSLSNPSQWGTSAEAAVTLESSHAAISLILSDKNTESGVTEFHWVIM